ncbi:hypothetical protein ACX0GZ_04635 [Sphingomonas aestuarii]
MANLIPFPRERLSLRFRPEQNDPWIVVREEAFGAAFEVVVLPTPAGVGHDCEFPTYAAALEYGERLSRTLGWKLHDQVGDSDRVA